MKRKQYLIGSGCIDKIDTQIKAQQINRSQLMNTLHNEFGIPWQRLWNKCEARLQDMLRLQQKYNLKHVNKLVYSTRDHLTTYGSCHLMNKIKEELVISDESNFRQAAQYLKNAERLIQ